MRARIVPFVAPASAATACGGREAAAPVALSFKSTNITDVEWDGDFHLVDQGGRASSVANIKDKVVVLFPEYTHRPDMCPTTLAQMAQVRGKLRANLAAAAEPDKKSKVHFNTNKADPNRRYTVDHTGVVCVFDQAGFLRLRVIPGTGVAAMAAADVARLTKETT